MSVNNNVSIKGCLSITRINSDGDVVEHVEIPNIITAVGDQYYAGRAALATGLPAQVTGMRLGGGSTAPAKTGAGAALVTYLTNSNQALDANYPTVAAGVVTWRATFAPGKATSASAITEAVLVNDTIATNATSTAANTISRALVTGISAKAAGDTLVVQWTHTLAGS
jgi:hypothetical protein